MKIENNTESVASLAEILKANNLSEIEVKEDDFSIRIVAKTENITYASPVSVQASAVSAPAQAEASVTPSGNVVKSPIIGTFYASPSPEKASFVTLGSKVNKGDVICIVESMKLMNEITSEFSGTVAEIYAKNSDAVEYDQPLMRIE